MLSVSECTYNDEDRLAFASVELTVRLRRMILNRELVIGI